MIDVSTDFHKEMIVAHRPDLSSCRFRHLFVIMSLSFRNRDRL